MSPTTPCALPNVNCPKFWVVATAAERIECGDKGDEKKSGIEDDVKKRLKDLGFPSVQKGQTFSSGKAMAMPEKTKVELAIRLRKQEAKEVKIASGGGEQHKRKVKCPQCSHEFEVPPKRRRAPP